MKRNSLIIAAVVPVLFSAVLAGCGEETAGGDGISTTTTQPYSFSYPTYTETTVDNPYTEDLESPTIESTAETETQRGTTKKTTTKKTTTKKTTTKKTTTKKVTTTKKTSTAKTTAKPTATKTTAKTTTKLTTIPDNLPNSTTAKTTASTTTTKADPGIRVTGVTLDKTTLELGVGKTYSLKITVAPSNAYEKGYSIISSSNAIASVTQAGVITAKAAGTAVITVKTVDGGYSATCTVTVKNIPVTAISVSAPKISVKNGETLQLKATIAPSDATDQSVTWSSSDEKLATINASTGLMTANSKNFTGKVYITATAKDGSGVSRTVTIEVLAATN